MFIKIHNLVNDFRLHIKGIIHIGAHYAEEAEDYKNQNISKVIWIEANPRIMDGLRGILSKFPGNVCHSFAAYSEDDKVMNFNITNNGQSSSLLEFGLHQVYHPDVTMVDKCDVTTKRMDTFMKENPQYDPRDYNFLNLDIQGAELEALKGFGYLLKHVDYIYSEVNSDEVYKGCALVEELDSYLDSFGFKRVTTAWTNAKWGDAFYIKVVRPM